MDKSSENTSGTEKKPYILDGIRLLCRLGLRHTFVGRVYRKVCNSLGLHHNRLLALYGVGPRVHYAWIPIGGGVAIHRYYTEEYLKQHSADIRGVCLEFEDDVYSSRIGGDRVEKLEILNVDDSSPSATIIADLTKPNQIPDNQFDCIVCTYVLHCIWDYPAVILDMKRILKPGGVLIGCVPFIMGYTPDANEFWRFSPEGLDQIMTNAFGSGNFTVTRYGNSLTAMADVRGLAAEKFKKAELDACDPRYPVILAFRAVKPH
jgi:SAM-dependent methyltransferase